jgi:hypothetical protein
MNEKSSSISHPLEVHSISTDASVNGEWKPRRGKKRNKNHARAGDHAGAHASPPVEAEAEIESNKAQPPAEGLILSIDADASYALPPREDAAFAALGSDGRALASHPAQVQPGKGLMAALEPIPPEPEFSDEHRAMMLKRWADHLASLKPEPIGQPPVERDRNEVPVSKLKQRMEANGHDRPPEPIAPTHQPGTADDGGDHLRQEPLPGTDQAVDPNAGTPGPAPGRKAKRTGLMAVLPEEDDDAQA